MERKRRKRREWGKRKRVKRGGVAKSKCLSAKFKTSV
jgi:hypothetical protein